MTEYSRQLETLGIIYGTKSKIITIDIAKKISFKFR